MSTVISHTGDVAAVPSPLMGCVNWTSVVAFVACEEVGVKVPQAARVPFPGPPSCLREAIWAGGTIHSGYVRPTAPVLSVPQRFTSAHCEAAVKSAWGTGAAVAAARRATGAVSL